MSWVVDEWKDGLPAKALQKIREMETKLERLSKEQKQKHFQMESLEAAYNKQLRKAEEDKNLQATLQRDNQMIEEACQELEKKKAKVLHDLQAKEKMAVCLEGKLLHTQQQLEAETNRASQVKNELDRVRTERNNSLAKLEKLGGDHARLQDNFNQQQHHLEGQNQRVKALQKAVSNLRDKLDLTEGRHRNYSGSSIGSSVSEDESPSIKQQLKEMEMDRNREMAKVKNLQEQLDQAKVNNTAPDPKRPATPDLMSFDSPSKPKPKQATPSSNSHRENMILQDFEKAISDVKKENEGLLHENHQLEVKIQAKDKELSDLQAQMADMTNQLDETRKELTNREAALTKQNNNANTTKVQLEKTNAKLEEVEKKSKQIVTQLECQSHNAEAARLSLEQKAKEREKEYKQELSQHTQAFTNLDKQYNDTKNKHQQDINKLNSDRHIQQAQLEKAQLGSQKAEKLIGELKEKVNATTQGMVAHEKNAAQLEKTITDLTREKENLACKLEQGNCKIDNMERQVVQLKQKSQHNEGVANDLGGKLQQKENEIETLSSKSDNRFKEMNNITQNLKLQLSNLEAQNASAKDLTMKQVHENEQLIEKLTTSEELQRKLQQQVDENAKETDGLRSEINYLKQQSKDSQAVAENAKEGQAQLDETIQTKEGKITELLSQMEESKHELESLSSQLKKMAARQENNEQVLGRKDADIAVFREKIQELESSLQQVDVTHANSTKEVKDENNHLKMQIADFERQLRDEESLMVTLQDQSGDIADQLGCTKKQLQQKCDDIHTLEAKLAAQKVDLTQTIRELEAKCQQMDRECSTLTQNHECELEAKSSELGNVLNQVSELQQSAEKMSEHLQFFESRCSQLQTSHDEMKLTNDMLETEKSQHDAVLQTKNDELEQQQALHAHKIADLETVVANLRNETSRLHADYRKACELADSKASEATDLLNKLETSEAEVIKMRDRWHRVETELVTVKTAEQDAKEHMSELEKNAAENSEVQLRLQEDLAAATSQLELLGKQHQDVVDTLQQQLHVAQAEIESRSQEISELSKNTSRLEENVEHVSQQRAEAITDLENAMASVELRSNEAVELEGQLDNTKAQLCTAQQNFEDALRSLSDAQRRGDIAQDELQNLKEILSNKEEDTKAFTKEIEEQKSELHKSEKSYQTDIEALNIVKASLDVKLGHAAEIIATKDAHLSDMTSRLDKSEAEVSVLQEKVHSFEQWEVDAEKVKESLEEQLVCHRDLLIVRDEEISRLTAELQQLQTSFDKTTSDLGSKVTNLESVKLDLSYQSEQIQKALEERHNIVDELSSQIATKECDITCLQTSHANIEKELHILRESKSELEDNFKAVQDQLTSKELLLRDQGNEIVKHQERLDQTISEKALSLKALETSNSSLSEQLNQSTALVSQKIAQIDLLQDEYDTLRQEHDVTVAAFHSDVSGLRDVVTKTQTELDKVTELKRASKEEMVRITDLLTESNDEKERMQGRLELIQMDIEDKDECMEAFNEQVGKMETSIKALEETKRQNSEAISGYKNELSSAQNEVDLIRKENERLLKHVEELTQRQSHQEETVHDLKTELAEKVCDITSLTEETCTLKAGLDIQMAEVQSKTEQAVLLNDSLEKNKENVESVKMRLGEQVMMTNSLEEKCTRLTIELESKNTLIEDKEHDAKTLSEQLNEMQQRLSTLQEQHETSTEKAKQELHMLLSQLEISQMNLDDGEHSRRDVLEKLEQSQQLTKQKDSRISALSTESEEHQRVIQELEIAKALLERNLFETDSKMKVSVDKQTSVVADLQQKIVALEEEKSALDGQLKENISHLENTTTDLKSLAEQADEQREKSDLLQQRYEELKSSHSELSKEFDLVVGQKDVLVQASQKMREEVEELGVMHTQSGQDADIEIQALRNQLHSLTAEHERLQIMYDDVTGAYKDISSKHEETTVQLEQLTATNAEQLTNSLATIAVLKQSVEHLTSELESSQNNLDVTVKNLMEKESLCCQLEESVSNEREQSGAVISEVTKEQTCIEAQLKEEGSRLLEANELLESLREENSSLVASTETLEMSVNALTEKSARQEKLIIQQGNEICDFEQALSEKDVEMEQMTRNINDLEGQKTNSHSDYKKELVGKKKEIASLQNELLQLRDALEGSEAALRLEMEKVGEKEKDIESFKEKGSIEVNELRRQLELLNMELKTAQQTHIEDSHRIDGLISQATLLTSRLESDKESYERQEFEIIEREGNVSYENSTLRQEIVTLKDSILEKEDMITRQGAAVEELSEQLAYQKKSSNLAEKDLLSKIQMLESEACLLDQQLKKNMQSTEQLQGEFDSLKTSFVEEKVDLLQCLAENEERTESTKESSRKEIEALTAELQNLKQVDQDALEEQMKLNCKLQEDLNKTRDTTLMQTKFAEDELSSLKEDKLDLESSLKCAVQSLEEKEAEHQQLKRMENESSKKFQYSVERIEALQAELRQQQDALTVSNQESTEMREELEQTIHLQGMQVTSLSLKLETHQEEAEVLMEKKTEMQQELISLKQSFMDDNDILKALQEELEAKLLSAEQSHDNTKKRLNDAVKELESLRMATEQQHYELTELKAGVECNALQDEEGVEKTDALSADNSKLQEDLENVRDEKKTLQMDLNASQNQLICLREEVQLRQLRQDELLEQLGKMEENRGSLESELQSKDTQNKRDQEMNEYLQREAEETKNALRCLQSEKNEVMCSLDELQKDISTTKEVVETTQNQKLLLQEEVAILTLKVQDLDLVIVDLKEQVSKEMTAKFDHLEQLKIVDAGVATLKIKINNLENQISGLESEKDEAVKSLGIMQQELQNNTKIHAAEKSDLLVRLEMIQIEVKVSEEDKERVIQELTEQTERNEQMEGQLVSRQAEVGDGMDICKDLRYHIASLETENTAIKGKQKDLEASVEEQADKIDGMVTKMSALEVHNSDLKMQLKNLQANGEQREEQLVVQLERLKEELVVAEDMVNSLNSKNVAAADDEGQLVDQMSLVEQELSEKIQRLESLEASLESLEKEKAELAAKLKTALQNLEEANLENWDTTESLQDRLIELAAAEEKIIALTQNIQLLEVESKELAGSNADLIAAHEDRVNNLTDTLQEATEKHQQVTCVVSELEDTNTKLVCDLDSLQSELASLKQENERLRVDGNDWSDQIASLQIELGDYKEQVKQLEYQLASSKKLLEKMELGTEEELGTLSADIVNLKDQVRELSCNYKQVQEENLRLINENAEIQSSEVSMKELIEHLENQEQESQKSRTNLEDLVQFMECEQSQNSRTLAELNTKLKTSESSKNKISEELEAVCSSKEQLEADVFNAESETRTLQREKSALVEQVSALQNERAHWEKLASRAEESQTEQVYEVTLLKSKLVENEEKCKQLERQLEEMKSSSGVKEAVMTTELDEAKMTIRATDADMKNKKLELSAMTSENKDLERSLQAKHDELLRLQATWEMEVTGYEAKLMAVEGELKDKVDELQSKNEKVNATLTTHLEEERLRLGNLQDVMRSKEEEYSSTLKETQAQLVEVRAHHTQQDEVIKKLRSELKVSEQIANEAVLSAEQAMKRLEKELSPGKKYQQRIKKLEAQCTELRGQLANDRPTGSSEKLGRSKEGCEPNVEKIQSLIKETQELKMDKESLQGKLQFALNNSRRLEKDHSGLQKHVVRLESEIKTLKSAAKSPAARSRRNSSNAPHQEKCDLERALSAKTEEVENVKAVAKIHEKEANEQTDKYANLIKRYWKLEATNETLTSKVTILANMLKAAKAAAKTSKPAASLASQEAPKPVTASRGSTGEPKGLVPNHNRHVNGGLPAAIEAPSSKSTMSEVLPPVKTPSPNRRQTRLSARRQSNSQETAASQPTNSQPTNSQPITTLETCRQGTGSQLIPNQATMSKTTRPSVVPAKRTTPESHTGNDRTMARRDETTTNQAGSCRIGKRPLSTPVKPAQTKRSKHQSGNGGRQPEQPYQQQPAADPRRESKLTTRSRLRPPTSRVTRSSRPQQAIQANTETFLPSHTRDGLQKGFTFRPSTQSDGLSQHTTGNRQSALAAGREVHKTRPASALETITNSPRKISPTLEITKRSRIGGPQRSLSLKKSPDHSRRPKAQQQTTTGTASKEENCQIQ